MTIRITNVRYGGLYRNHESISDYRWVSDADGEVGSTTKAVMVAWIDNGGQAYVLGGPSRATVHTVHPTNLLPYCQTKADGVWTNNLLSLPTF